MVYSLGTVHSRVSLLNDQGAHVVSCLLVVFGVSSVTERELFGPPTAAVHSFVAQILHVERVHDLGVVLLDVQVHQCSEFTELYYS